MKRFSRFSIVGLVVNGSLYLLFLALVWAGLPAVGVSAFCYMFGVGLSYVLNRHWSFESRARHGHDLPRFLLAYGTGLVVTMASISILLEPLGPALAQILTIGVAALTIFGALHLLRFGAEN
jgi:putative flippase GtrA